VLPDTPPERGRDRIVEGLTRELTATRTLLDEIRS
jgi:hypothetical protein